jgi:hypothetical protein
MRQKGLSRQVVYFERLQQGNQVVQEAVENAEYEMRESGKLQRCNGMRFPISTGFCLLIAPKNGVDIFCPSVYLHTRRRLKGLAQIKLASPK